MPYLLFRYYGAFASLINIGRIRTGAENTVKTNICAIHSLGGELSRLVSWQTIDYLYTSDTYNRVHNVFKCGILHEVGSLSELAVSDRIRHKITPCDNILLEVSA